MSLLELFCDVDDYCQTMRQQTVGKLTAQAGKRVRQPSLRDSEIITILIHFHQSHYRDFKAYYRQQVQSRLQGEFPGVMSYARFISLVPRVVGLGATVSVFPWCSRGRGDLCPSI